MSHDHLQYDRRIMRHRDMNRMDGKNLDEKMKIRRVNHRKMVGPKTDDRMRLHRGNHLMMVCLKKISVMRSASYYRHGHLGVSLNNYLRTYLFLVSLVVARYLVVLCNKLIVACVTYVT